VLLQLSLLKNVFDVEIGLQMIAAEFMGGPYIADVCDRGEMNGNSGHRCVSTEVGSAPILHTEPARVGSLTLRSSGATFVAMMQTAHLREGDNLACRGRLDWARLRTILVE
jgi:hypothetical protein